ncbi:hypothetical protein ACHAXT_005060 [Thalassiosira profunda]
MKQQASLLSFFGKGKGAKKKRPASDCNGGGGGSSAPSRQRSPARKQAKRACTKTKIEDGASYDGAPRRNGIVSDAPIKSIEEEAPQKIYADDPAASCNDNGSAEIAGAPSSAMTQSAHDNEAKAPSPPSPATDATGATESSDSEEESDDDSSASSSDSGADANNNASTANNTNGEGKSAYELLRERNIARNNARLKELGLLSGVTTHGATNNTAARRSRPRKKAKSDTNKTASLPSRRSSRLRKPVITEQGSELGPPLSCEELVAQKAVEVEAEAEEEQFTVSPLFEYKMSSDDCKSNINATDASAECSGSGITTLVPKGPRLVPPSGLNAIYSLQFHPESWEEASGSGSGGNGASWLVGAGKSGLISLWDCSQPGTADDGEYIEPVISWKGHGGRWVADARFLPPPQTSFSEGTSAMVPSRLLTAANDGTICHWDLTSTSVQTGVPKLIDRSGKGLHSSGIFSMDVRVHDNGSGAYIVTGSKDKTLAVSRLDGLDDPVWRSDFHSAKVGSVCFSASHLNPLIASASDDGLVGIHDARLNGSKGGSNRVVAKLEDAHFKPHSAVWRPGSDSVFMTAGLDEVVKLWDLRNVSSPIASYHGHVPGSAKRLKRIHRPTFFNAVSSTESFILSGGEGSGAISMFQLGGSNEGSNEGLRSVFSRGSLPEDVGDVGSLAVKGTDVAVAGGGGEVLMLSPEHHARLR